MFIISREVDSLDIIIRLSGIEEASASPLGMAEELRERLLSFLAEEFLKKYQNGILGALNADDIAYKLNDAIAELVKRKLLGDTNAK